MATATRYKMPEAMHGAAVFDPECVVLGSRVIDWCSFGFGNTVIVDPMPLGMASRSLESAAREFGAEHGWSTFVSPLTDEMIRDGSRPRTLKEYRLAVCFTRQQMVDISMSQAEYLGAVERR